MTALEATLHELSKLFLAPVLVVLSLMFVFALFEAGRLLVDLGLRWSGAATRQPLHRYAERHPRSNQETLELQLLKSIEPLRIASRVAPLLGLVATMIPMGPALIAVSSGDMGNMAENLVVAFSAVVIALLAASVTYVVLTVRRRWLLQELNSLLSGRDSLDRAGDSANMPATTVPRG